MQQKAHFLTAIPQVMTAKPVGHAPVPPVMSRSSATDAAPVRTSHGNYTGVMLMREHITINLNISLSAVLTESSKSPVEQLFGVELRSEADCEYPLDLQSNKQWMGISL